MGLSELTSCSLTIRSKKEGDLVTLGLGCGPKGNLRLMCIERA